MSPEELVEGVENLVSLPDVVIRINQLIEAPDTSMEDIGNVISHDAGLSARLLKLVNSALYNFSGTVDTVSRALTIVGTNELRSLAVASSAVSTFEGINPDLVDMNAFWLRSVYCGLVTRKLAIASGQRNGETQFLSGLLHDIGKLIIFNRMPDAAERILQRSAESGSVLYQIEQEELGFTSAEVGSALLELWRLPEDLWEPVRYQHHPGDAPEYHKEAYTLYSALIAANRFEPEVKLQQAQATQSEQLILPAQAADALQITDEQFNAQVFDADMECFEVFNVLSPSAGGIY